MELNLTKDDLKSLVKGTSPSYDVMNHQLVKSCGDYIGGFHDRWDWNSGLDALDEKQLLELYNICKDSWN